ncbi:hypothetical protein HK405_015564 [Cladochytrium tenue]|nr:hypothetical protein HK405_015564 [Cladochytrium tenue]
MPATAAAESSSSSATAATTNSANAPILRRPRSLLPLAVAWPASALGLVLLGAAALPRSVTAALGAATLLAVATFAWTDKGVAGEGAVPRRGRFTAYIPSKPAATTSEKPSGGEKDAAAAEDDDGRAGIVVFLIGARYNGTGPASASASFRRVGRAFVDVMKDLQSHPELGCLGAESYVGDGAGGSTTLSVQYWRNASALQAYAAARDSSHSAAWLWLMRHARQAADVGFWHETYVVAPGAMEAIHVNCPPFHLLAARGARVARAEGRYASMGARLSTAAASDVNDARRDNGVAFASWPEGFASHASY